MVDDHGLTVAELDPAWWWTPGARDVVIPPEVDPLDVFRYDQTELLRIAELFGARSINAADVLGGNWSREEGAAGFAELCDRAADRGLLVHLEWLAWSKVPDLDAALEIVRLADRPNGGLQGLPGEQVLAIQIDDGPAAAEDNLVDATLHHRRLPGDGDFDLVGYVAALRATGTLAPLGVEVFSDELHALGADEAARRAAVATRRLLDDVGGEETS
jgi:sugar phosphate isomerase/epimerase